MTRAWRAVRRDFFPFRTVVPTRWSDNDAYGHVNNSVSHFYQDTVINLFLLKNRLLLLPGAPENDKQHIHASCQNVIGIVASNSFEYFSSISYPQTLEAGVCVTHIGRSSVTYRTGLFLAKKSEQQVLLPSCLPNQEQEEEDPSLKQLGRFVHVYVNKETQKPVSHLPEELKAALKELLVEEPK